MTSLGSHVSKNVLEIATFELFEVLIWLKMTSPTNKLESLVYSYTFSYLKHKRVK